VIVADYARWLADLSEWAANREFRLLVARHLSSGGGVAEARALATAEIPQVRARLAAVRDDQIKPLLSGTTDPREQNELVAGMVLFTHEAEDRLTGLLMNWLNAGAPPVVS